MIAACARAALALTVLLAAGCSFYLGEPRVPKTDFRAALNGSSEVPPTQSRGSGYFEAVYRPSTKVLEYRLNLVGLSGPITMGYLHGPAGPGENAEKVTPINIPIYYYNSGISHSERSLFRDHLALCQSCASDFLRLAKIIRENDDKTQSAWERIESLIFNA